MATFKDMLNKANPQELADLLRAMKFGDFARAETAYLHLTKPAAGVYDGATLVVLALPDSAKAATVVRACARAGTTTGEYTPQAYASTPTTGQVAVTPCGNIAFLGTDAPDQLDVVYQPDRYDVIEMTLPVVSNAIAIPTSFTTQGVKFLMEAEALAGTTTGKKIIQAPSGSAASAANARLDLAKANVKFNSGDAVTSARVKLALVPAVDANALLESTATF